MPKGLNLNIVCHANSIYQVYTEMTMSSPEKIKSKTTMCESLISLQVLKNG